MENKRIVIVGGVAGGASTAARLRRLDESATIIMFEKGRDISYANCGLPYYIGNIIRERDALKVTDQTSFSKKFNIDVRTYSEVTQIQPTDKTITVFNHQTKENYQETYDYLVLSPGGEPVKPPLPGIDSSRIFTLRSLEDMDKIKNSLIDQQVSKAVIVGAGFIGIEVAENLRQLGISTSIIEMADQILAPVDFEMAATLHSHLKTKQVELFLSDGVKEFTETEKSIQTILSSGRTIESQLVILAIGVRPETRLAAAAGLELGERKGIAVNERMQTSVPNIYALGDATEIKHSVLGTKTLIPLANSANKQGRIVADNIMGSEKTYDSTPATAIVKVFDLTAGVCGINEKQATSAGIDYEKVHLTPADHASYYPDSTPVLLKLLYGRKTGKLLGAQAIGENGIDKRIDVIAAMIQQEKTVYDLAELELAYAPPYGSAKDPVNLAGMIAINQIEEKNPVVHWNQVPDLKRQNALFIDVRDPEDFLEAHIDGAINIPFEEIRDRLNEIPKNRKVIFYCYQGKTAYFALRILLNLGYLNISNLSGGYSLYYPTILQQENVGIHDGYSKQAQLSSPFENLTEVHTTGPIMQLAQDLKSAQVGDIVEVVTSDPNFKTDIRTWCERTQNTLISVEEVENKCIGRIQKDIITNLESRLSTNKNMLVCTSDLDRIIRAFLLAYEVMKMGRKVSMHFAFWGVNILRKPGEGGLKKNLLDGLYEKRLIKRCKKLGLTNQKLTGIGVQMLRVFTENSNINTIEELVQDSINSGIRLVVCEKSLKTLGIHRDDIFDGIEIGEVNEFFFDAEHADTNFCV